MHTEGKTIRLIFRFKRFVVYKIVDWNRRVNHLSSTLQGGSSCPPPPQEEDFRWESQLFPPPPVPKPHLQTFYDSHNQNVRTFQALLDDSEKANYSREGTLGPLTYRKFLETDAFLHSATCFVNEIESQLPELLLTCREKYITDKLYGVLGSSSQSLPSERGMIVVPVYATATDASPVPGVNQWTVTDQNWKPTQTTFHAHRFALSSFAHSKASGVLTKDAAIMMAFLELAERERWNRFNLRSGDSCRVQIDTEKGAVTVQCLRWGKYSSEIILVLPPQLRHTGSPLRLMLHRVGSRHELAKKVLDSMTSRFFTHLPSPSSGLSGEPRGGDSAPMGVDRTSLASILL
jgi:hypothetical protein